MPKFINKNNHAIKPTKSYWSESTRRLFETLKEIPWASFTALSTFLGVLILGFYFKSIDYFPSEFSSLIGLGAAASVTAAVFLVAFGLGLFAPSAIYAQYVDKKEASLTRASKAFNKYELIFLQLGGMGIFFLLLSYIDYQACGDTFGWYLAVSMPLLVLSAFHFFKIVRRQTTQTQRLLSATTALGVIALAVTPVVVIWPVAQLFASSAIGVAALLVIWLLVVVLNAGVAGNIPKFATAITAVAFAVYLYVLVPFLAETPSYFPTVIASFLSVRDNVSQDLRVPKKTCELILSAIDSKTKSDDVGCTAGDWSQVRAKTLSNVGERWLIEVNLVSASNALVTSTLRLTIPRGEVQVINPQHAKKVTSKANACQQRKS
jgi:hypothetical protein